MAKKVSTCSASALVLCAVAVVHAQSSLRPGKGSKELGISVDYYSNAGNNSFAGTGSIGYYFNDQIVGEFGFSVKRGNQDLLYAGARFEFISSGQLAPYLLAGFLEQTSGDKRVTFKPGAGANFYVHKNLSLFAEVTFFRFVGTNSTTTDLNLGLRYFFK